MTGNGNTPEELIRAEIGKIDTALTQAEAARAQVEVAMQAVVAEAGLVPGDVVEGLADIASSNGKQAEPKRKAKSASPPAKPEPEPQPVAEVETEAEAEAEVPAGVGDDGLDELFDQADDLEQELRERLDEPEEEAADPPADDGDDFWSSILEEEGDSPL